MQDIQLKTIELTYKQLNMIYTMIRSAEIRTEKFTRKQTRAASLIWLAKRQTIPGRNSTIELGPEDCQTIRTFNTDYCEILVKNECTSSLQKSEVVEIYQMATDIQLLFTSRN